MDRSEGRRCKDSWKLVELAWMGDVGSFGEERMSVVMPTKSVSFQWMLVVVVVAVVMMDEVGNMYTIRMAIEMLLVMERVVAVVEQDNRRRRCGHFRSLSFTPSLFLFQGLADRQAYGCLVTAPPPFSPPIGQGWGGGKSR